METTAQDFERIPRTNLRVRLTDFARLWLEVERRADALKDAGKGDWYLTGVQMTCRWLAHASVVFNYPSGPVREPATSPITRTRQRAYEELIELEARAAERWVGREWPGRPGFIEGVMATLGWTWRRSIVRDLRHVQASGARCAAMRPAALCSCLTLLGSGKGRRGHPSSRFAISVA